MDHLLLGAQKTLFEAPAVTDAQLAAGCSKRLEDALRIVAIERDGFLDQHRFTELKRPYDGRGVLAFGCRDKHCVDFRALDHLEVVRRMHVGAGLLGKGARSALVDVGNRDKPD